MEEKRYRDGGRIRRSFILMLSSRSTVQVERDVGGYRDGGKTLQILGLLRSIDC